MFGAEQEPTVANGLVSENGWYAVCGIHCNPNGLICANYENNGSGGYGYATGSRKALGYPVDTNGQFDLRSCKWIRNLIGTLVDSHSLLWESGCATKCVVPNGHGPVYVDAAAGNIVIANNGTFLFAFNDSLSNIPPSGIGESIWTYGGLSLGPYSVSIAGGIAIVADNTSQSILGFNVTTRSLVWSVVGFPAFDSEARPFPTFSDIIIPTSNGIYVVYATS